MLTIQAWKPFFPEGGHDEKGKGKGEGKGEGKGKGKGKGHVEVPKLDSGLTLGPSLKYEVTRFFSQSACSGLEVMLQPQSRQSLRL